jgi:hypothetical protein
MHLDRQIPARHDHAERANLLRHRVNRLPVHSSNITHLHRMLLSQTMASGAIWNMGGIFVLIGSIGAGVCGVLGQLTTFRDAFHAITRRARWVFLGVALSIAITLLGKWLSDREGGKASAARQEDLLRTIWRQGNKVEAADVSVLVSYSFLEESTSAPPPILAENWKLEVRATNKLENQPKAFNEWSSKALLSGDQLILTGNSQTVSIRAASSVDGTSYGQFSRFTNFTGDTKKFVHLTDLNGALVEIHLTGYAPGLPKAIADSLAPQPTPSPVPWKRWHFNETYVLSFENPNPRYAVMPSPVEAEATLLIRSRPVAKVKGLLASVIERDEHVQGYVQGLVVLKFPIVQVPAKSFEQFAPTLPAQDLRREWPEIGAITAGGILALALITAIGFILVTPNAPPVAPAE